MEALAALPIWVICDLLGVPFEDRTQFRAWSEAAADTHDAERSQQGLADLFGYGHKLVARKREQPGDDIISRYCAREDATDESIAQLCMGLLFAGHETTVTAIGFGALSLLSDRSQWQSLVDNPRQIPAAVDEMLRMPGGSNGGLPRYARTDMEIGGAQVKLGDLVLLDISAANHDAALFPDPDQVDVTRQGPPHLTFGHGAHFCVGVPLAKLELQIVFTQLIARFPTMRLTAEVKDLTLRRDLVSGLHALPVTW